MAAEAPGQLRLRGPRRREVGGPRARALRAAGAPAGAQGEPLV